MKIAGKANVPASRERVWELLNSPEALSQSLPGCQKFEPESDTSFQVGLRIGLGPVRAECSGVVRIGNQQPPETLTLTVKSSGTWGFAEGSGNLTLSESNGQTQVSYVGDVSVGGVLAGVGQRMLEGAAKTMIAQFFANIKKVALSGE